MHFSKAEHIYFYSIGLWQWSNLIFFFFTFSIFCFFCFLMKRGVSETVFASVFRKGQPLIWWAPHILLLWVTGQSRSVSLLRYVPENRSCPSVVPGSWLSTIKNWLEDLKSRRWKRSKKKKKRLRQWDICFVVYGLSTSHISKNFLSHATNSSWLWGVMRQEFRSTL